MPMIQPERATVPTPMSARHVHFTNVDTALSIRTGETVRALGAGISGRTVCWIAQNDRESSTEPAACQAASHAIPLEINTDPATTGIYFLLTTAGPHRRIARDPDTRQVLSGLLITSSRRSFESYTSGPGGLHSHDRNGGPTPDPPVHARLATQNPFTFPALLYNCQMMCQPSATMTRNAPTHVQFMCSGSPQENADVCALIIVHKSGTDMYVL